VTKQLSLLTLSILFGGHGAGHAQQVGEALRTPEKAVAVVNQTLSGTWLYELRRGGQPTGQPPVLLLIQFNPDGTINASAADGSQSAHVGMWLRVGDRKFMITTFLFSFNEARAFTSILKIRGNIQLSQDGQTVSGSQEVVIMDREGKPITTAPGGSFTGVRLSPEIAADFYDFQAR
jgi:hypothetical protein